MPRNSKDYYLIVDTETTIKDHVVDFGAVVCDRRGNIEKQTGILLKEFFGVEALFFRTDVDASEIWSEQGKDRRFTRYLEMIDSGERMIASVPALLRWLWKVKETYNPIVTAYNLAFDLGKLMNSGVNLQEIFPEKFCLWQASFDRWAMSKKYRQFVLDNHAFNPPTEYGNMSYQTNAEIMARFVLKNPALPDEPHTALEDAREYELPILQKLVATTPKKKFLVPINKPAWQRVQVREHFKAK